METKSSSEADAQRYEVVEAASASAFLDAALAFLSKHEVANNVLIGNARRQAVARTTSQFWLAYDTQDETRPLRGAAMHAQGFALLFAMPTTPGAALATEARLRDVALPAGVNGPRDASEAFARAREARLAALSSRSAPWVAGLRLLAYEVRRAELVAAPPARDETTRPLDPRSQADVATAEALCGEFDAAIGHSGASATTVRLFKDGLAKILVAEGVDDGAPRAVVASARETPSLGVVNAVYTREAWRRRGCASRAVAAMASHLFDAADKDRVALYADADDRGPNRLYRSLGFEPVAALHLYKPSSLALLPPDGDDADEDEEGDESASE